MCGGPLSGWSGGGVEEDDEMLNEMIKFEEFVCHCIAYESE